MKELFTLISRPTSYHKSRLQTLLVCFSVCSMSMLKSNILWRCMFVHFVHHPPHNKARLNTVATEKQQNKRKKQKMSFVTFFSIYIEMIMFPSFPMLFLWVQFKSNGLFHFWRGHLFSVLVLSLGAEHNLSSSIQQGPILKSSSREKITHL